MEIWKKIEIVGCEMEDGTDTRKSTTSFHIINDEDYDNWAESMADDYGYQDYSYQIKYLKVLALDVEEMEQLLNVINKKMENTNERI